MKQETRNLISAICLSMAVLIGYQMLFGKVPENDQINKDKSPKPGSYRGRLNSEPENNRKTLLGNKNARR